MTQLFKAVNETGIRFGTQIKPVPLESRKWTCRIEMAVCFCRRMFQFHKREQMFGKEAHRPSGRKRHKLSCAFTFLPPDSHHSDIEMEHLEPIRERVEDKINA